MGLSKHIAIVVAAFHHQHTETMLEIAALTASNLGLTIAETVRVPGSIETPLALRRVLAKQSIDGAIVLGVIEKGQTSHGLVIGSAVMNAILDLQINMNKPIGAGILGPEINYDQIEERLRPYAKHAVEAVNDMLKLKDDPSNFIRK